MHPKMLQSADGPGAVLADFGQGALLKREQIAYVVTGRNEQRFVGKDSAGLFLLPAEWLIKEKKWEPWQPHRVAITGRASYTALCAGCHTTGFDVATETWTEPGVGCECCHGPGERHVQGREDTPGETMVNPAHLPFARQNMVCGQCHSAGFDKSGLHWYPTGFFPGDDLEEHFDLAKPSTGDLENSFPANPRAAFWADGTSAKHRQQYLDLRSSKHWQAGVGCLTCHRAHGGTNFPAQLRDAPLAICAQCHADIVERGEEHSHHAPQQANCLDCHMPRTVAFRRPGEESLHAFQAPNPALAQKTNSPSACIACHAHADKDNGWAAAALAQWSVKR